MGFYEDEEALVAFAYRDNAGASRASHSVYRRKRARSIYIYAFLTNVGDV